MKYKRVVALLMAGIMVLSHEVMPIADELIDVEEELVGVGADFEELSEEEYFKDDQVVIDDRWKDVGTGDILADEFPNDSVYDETLFEDDYPEAVTEGGQLLDEDFYIGDDLEELFTEAEPELQDANIVRSGTCGDNLTWTLDSDGTLIISGTGPMVDYKVMDPNYNGGSPFYSWESIRTVIIGSGVTSIGNRAFADCTKLISIELPESVTRIGVLAFCQCHWLESIEIPDSVKSIGDSAFFRCFDLNIINLPEGVTSIGNNAFDGCPAIRYANIGTETAKALSRANYSFREPGSKVALKYTYSDGEISGLEVAYVDRDIRDVVFPDGVTSIGKSAFSGCTNLTSIVIPDSVTSIGDSAFSDCTNGTIFEWRYWL